MPICKCKFCNGKDRPLEWFGINPKTGKPYRTCDKNRRYKREYRKKPEHKEQHKLYSRRYFMKPGKRDHRREYMKKYNKAYRKAPGYVDIARIYRQQNLHKYREYQRKWAQSKYGVYCVYMPKNDEFKLGYGGVKGRLTTYKVTDPYSALVAFTPIGDKRTARMGEAKLLRETQIYNPNGNKRSEMRLNVLPMREYIRNNFEEIYHEEILDMPTTKRIVQTTIQPLEATARRGKNEV